MRVPRIFQLARKHFRRLVMVGACLGAMVTIWLASPSEPKGTPREASAPPAQPPRQGIAKDLSIASAVTEGQAQIQVLEERLSRLEEEKARLEQQLQAKDAEDRMRTALDEQRSRHQTPPLSPAQIQAMVKEQIEAEQARLQAQQATDAQEAPADGQTSEIGQRIWPQVAPVPPPEPGAAASEAQATPPTVQIPAGSRGRIVAIDGIAAIADGETMSANLRLVGDIRTPSGAAVPLGDCHLIVESDIDVRNEVIARLMFQGQLLSCVLSDGRTISAPVSGWVSAADNVQGLKAKVFRFDKEILKAFTKSAIPAALASVAKKSKTATSVSIFGTVSELSDPVSNIGEQMSEFYLDGARAYAHPLVWVDPSQRGYFTFAAPADLEGVTRTDLHARKGFNRAAYN